MLRIIFPALALGLAACGPSTFEADVTRFYDQAARLEPAGRTVRIEPAEEAMSGLEFASFADHVRAELTRLGFETGGGAAADLVVTMDYAVDPVAVADRGNGVSVSIGGGTGGGGLGVGGGISFPLGDREPERVYQRRLSLTFADPARGERLWEGRAVSVGATRDLSAALPLLAEALLKNFPGAAGETREVEIPLGDRDAP